MAGILHALATAAVKQVTLGGVEWRLRRVSSADLARAQAGALALLPVDPAPTKGKAKKSQQKGVQGLSPEALASTAKMAEAMACASVTHARAPGAEWEALTLVMDRDKADPDKGRLWVGDLTMSVRQGLFTEAMAHSTEDGEAVERLQSFRGTA